MLRSAAKAPHHAAAHHAPAQRSHDLPEHHAAGIDAVASLFISGKQFLARSETADWFIDLAEAPGIDADPAQVLHRIAGMCEFPVQHGAQPVGTDDEIAVAEITMHQRNL